MATPDQLWNTPDQRGEAVDTVTVAIDYAIIQHFSQNLYGSPNKAVEELVANSYDAWARQCYVYLPGSYSPRALLVWDDGESMDRAALHKLWWIAKSPKQGDGTRTEERANRSKRALIGKFGIGKLASYALGHRITHLTRVDDEFLRVTVDYRGVPELGEQDSAPRFETPIIKLTATEASDYVDSLTTQPLAAKAEFWDRKHWTLAVVDELKLDVELKRGRLKWLLANGMPFRPDFCVYVDDDDLEPRIAEGAFLTWTFADQEPRDQLVADWEDAQQLALVEGEPAFTDQSREVTTLPSLGDVRVKVRLFRESLFKGRSSDLDRSYGFFVMVRDRLLNPDDPLLLMHDPSFGTFYRTQFVIYADGLDAELLADREHIQSTSAMAQELSVVQAAIYRAARDELRRRDGTVELNRRSDSLLPVESRESFQDPMAALLIASGGEAVVDPRAARIERAPLEADKPWAVFRPESGGFVVNAHHPLFAVLSNRLGGGSKAMEALRAFDLLAVADRLLEGHLYDIGVPPEQIAEVMTWRDRLLRSVASKLEGAQSEIIDDVWQTSYQGGKEFELALARLFQKMGFVTSRDGLPKKKDVLVVAPIGQQEYRFIVEAKGCNSALQNDDAEIDIAASHLKNTGASLAVVVAREFAGFERPQGDPAILEQCVAVGGQVSIVNVETLTELYEAVRQYSYPLDMVRPVLAKIEAPVDKLNRVQRLRHPTEAFDFRGVLDAIWAAQNDRASGDLVAYRSIMQSKDEWKALGFDDFQDRVLALQTLSRGLMLVSRPRGEVILKQRPDIIANQITRSLLDESELP